VRTPPSRRPDLLETDVGPTTKAESVQAIHHALALGVNVFDVTPGCGHSKAEEVMGRALYGHQEQVVVAMPVRLARSAPAYTPGLRDALASQTQQEKERQ